MVFYGSRGISTLEIRMVCLEIRCTSSRGVSQFWGKIRLSRAKIKHNQHLSRDPKPYHLLRLSRGCHQTIPTYLEELNHTILTSLEGQNHTNITNITSLEEQNHTISTSLEGNNHTISTSLEGQNHTISTSLEGHNHTISTSLEGRNHTISISLEGKNQTNSAPLQGKAISSYLEGQIHTMCTFP